MERVLGVSEDTAAEELAASGTLRFLLLLEC